MRTRAAICWAVGRPWEIEEIDLDPPRAHEVLVRLAATGLCHSDDHIVTGDSVLPTPMVGGHEGAGIVEEVGPEVRSLRPGDRVVMSFLPACGRCGPCSTGHQNLCDMGAGIATGRQVDGSSRHHARGQDLNLLCMLGAFAEHTVVNEASVIKIEDRHSLRSACLVGCGAVTGWGSAVYAAEVRPDDVVVVVGLGGIGSSAVQGARLAGAKLLIGIDPVAMKRERAIGFGATQTFSSMDEALEPLRDLTRGLMANKVIMAMGVGDGELMADALALVAKRGRVVVTNIHPAQETHIRVNLSSLSGMEKQIVGCLFGSANPRVDIPKLLDLDARGQFDLDGLISRSYPLDRVVQGYEDLAAGLNIRGILELDASLL